MTVPAEEREMKAADNLADFKASYANAVAYGLSFLGKDLGEVFMYYLRIGYNVSAEETYENPTMLAQVLENILGFSAITIEKRIIRSLYSQAALDSSQALASLRIGHPGDFSKYVLEVRETMDRNTSGRT
jgi:hypothetical protein